MKITADIKSTFNHLTTEVSTNGASKEIGLSPKPNGYGSSINGGELLCLALATCYCNDIYREAAKLNINVKDVNVKVTAEFGAEGESGRNFKYQVEILSDASAAEINRLIQHTDKLAEIHNTLRKGVQVELVNPNVSVR
jgi:uncharacterized OsmC-like protein